MAKFLDNTGLSRLVALVKQALGTKADKTELPLVVEITNNNNVITCDTSIADIYTAYSDGRGVFAHFDGGQAPLLMCGQSMVVFSWFDDTTENFVIGSTSNNTDTWMVTSIELQGQLTFDSAPTANSSNPVTSGGIKTALDGKEDKPIEILTNYYGLLSAIGSATESNPATLTTELQAKYDDLVAKYTAHRKFTFWGIVLETDTEKYSMDSIMTFDSYLRGVGNNTSNISIYTNGQGGYWMTTASYDWQEELVSGTNIKTINNTSLLGSGNIVLNSNTILDDNGDPIQDVLDAKQNTLVSGTNIKTVQNTSLLGSGNININGGNIQYTGQEQHLLSVGDTVDASLDILDNAISNLNADSIPYTDEDKNYIMNGDTVEDCLEVLDAQTATINDYVQRTEMTANTVLSGKAIARDPVESRGNIINAANINVDVYTDIKVGDYILITYSGDDSHATNNYGQIAGWYTTDVVADLSNSTYQVISNMTSYAWNLSGKQYLIHVPTGIKAYALTRHNNLTVKVEKMGSIQADIYNLGTPNAITDISTTESSVSGGNNTVTITETNGTTTTLNVKNGNSAYQCYYDTTSDSPKKTEAEWLASLKGADGVSLGQVELVQTTGSNTDKVMSQNAVTEYGRKVTTEDLAGTSDYIRARLTENGWELNKYLNSSLNLANPDNYCVSFYIPMSNVAGHSITLYYATGASGTNYMAWYNSEKTYVSGCYYIQNANNYRTVTLGTTSSWESVAYLRITLNQSKLNECYVLDNTTGEYYFKGDDYLNSINASNLTLDTFLNKFVVQELGQSKTITVSQKSITDNIKYNSAIQRGTSVQMNGTRYVKLTQDQITMLNNSDIMSIRFMIYGSDASNGSMDWRYVSFGSTGTASEVFVIKMHFSGKIIVGAGTQSATTDLVAGQPSDAQHPIIATVVMDRVNGVVSYYKNRTLITTETANKYKISKFIDTSGIIYFAGGDQNARFYGVQFYDCDISKFWRKTYIYENEDNSTLSEVSPLFRFFTSNHSFVNYGSSNPSSGGWYRSGDYNMTEGENNTIVLTRKDNAAGTFLWAAYLQEKVAYILETDFNVDKPFHLSGSSYVREGSTVLYETNGDIVATATTNTASSTIVAGRYTLRSYLIEGGSTGIVTEEAGATVTVYSRIRRVCGCVAHFDFSTLYDNALYDNITKQFYQIYSDASCSNISTAHTLSQLPLRGVYTFGNLTAPHYVGEIKITGGKAYIADNTWTWKQINNS